MYFSVIKSLFGIHLSKRLFWEVDVLRGFALLFMVLVHFIWDLFYFDLISLHPDDIFGLVFRPRYLFLFLVGVSLFLSFSRGKKFEFFLKRGLLIIFWGLLTSLFAWLLIGELILFGVLHLIGFSVIVSYFLLSNRWVVLCYSFLCFVFGWFFSQFSSDVLWLGLLGFDVNGVSFVDHFPIFPWLGYVLLGFFVGSFFYSKKKRLFYLRDLSDRFPFNFLGFVGRNSLVIYLVHQPLFLGSFWIYLRLF